MGITLKEAADLIGGKITGDESILIENIAKIEEAKPGDLTYLYSLPYEKFVVTTQASAIIVKNGFNKSRNDLAYIEVDDPQTAFLTLIQKYFLPENKLTGVDASAFIDTTASIGEHSSVGKNVVISAKCKIGKNVRIFHNSVLLEGVEIGDNVLVYPNVTIRESCRIGCRVIIHSGSVIGADGFGYTSDSTGAYLKIPQIGNVIIEDDVEIGANCTIDRAALGSTIIRKGVKIDNLVQIGHNVEVGQNTVISAQCGVAGSTKLGKSNILAGQVGVVGHVTVADNVIIAAQSGVSKAISKSGTYFGSPAKEFKHALKLEALIRNLPQFADKIKLLEQQIKEIKEKSDI